jgi:hypothetical protein
MESQIENPNGLHAKYNIRKVKIKLDGEDFFGNPKYKAAYDDVEKGSEYFVLRLDENAGDIEHLKACRIAINSYAVAIRHHLPELANDLIKKYPLI